LYLVSASTIELIVVQGFLRNSATIDASENNGDHVFLFAQYITIGYYAASERERGLRRTRDLEGPPPAAPSERIHVAIGQKMKSSDVQSLVLDTLDQVLSRLKTLAPEEGELGKEQLAAIARFRRETDTVNAHSKSVSALAGILDRFLAHPVWDDVAETRNQPVVTNELPTAYIQWRIRVPPGQDDRIVPDDELMSWKEDDNGDDDDDDVARASIVEGKKAAPASKKADRASKNATRASKGGVQSVDVNAEEDESPEMAKVLNDCFMSASKKACEDAERRRQQADGARRIGSRGLKAGLSLEQGDHIREEAQRRLTNPRNEEVSLRILEELCDSLGSEDRKRELILLDQSYTVLLQRPLPTKATQRCTTIPGHLHLRQCLHALFNASFFQG
jgi:hypothetical protein